MSSALYGTVIHAALETITCELVGEGCGSLRDERAVAILRRLGGFTTIVMNCIADSLRGYERNPRATPTLEDVRRDLCANVPNLRARLQ